MKALPSNLDKPVIVVLLCVFFILLLGTFLNALSRRDVAAAALLGVVLLALGNAIRGVISAKRKR